MNLNRRRVASGIFACTAVAGYCAMERDRWIGNHSHDVSVETDAIEPRPTKFCYAKDLGNARSNEFINWMLDRSGGWSTGYFDADGEIVRIDFDICWAIDDSVIERASKLPRLREINCYGPALSGKAVAALEDLESLQTVRIAFASRSIETTVRNLQLRRPKLQIVAHYRPTR